MYFSKDADSVPTFESPWIHRGWTPAPDESTQIRGTWNQRRALVGGGETDTACTKGEAT